MQISGAAGVHDLKQRLRRQTESAAVAAIFYAMSRDEIAYAAGARYF